MFISAGDRGVGRWESESSVDPFSELRFLID